MGFALQCPTGEASPTQACSTWVEEDGRYHGDWWFAPSGRNGFWAAGTTTYPNNYIGDVDPLGGRIAHGKAAIVAATPSGIEAFSVPLPPASLGPLPVNGGRAVVEIVGIGADASGRTLVSVDRTSQFEFDESWVLLLDADGHWMDLEFPGRHSYRGTSAVGDAEGRVLYSSCAAMCERQETWLMTKPGEWMELAWPDGRDHCTGAQALLMGDELALICLRYSSNTTSSYRGEGFEVYRISGGLLEPTQFIHKTMGCADWRAQAPSNTTVAIIGYGCYPPGGYDDRYDGWLALSTDAGATWQEHRIVNGLEHGGFLEAATIDAAGHVHAVWSPASGESFPNNAHQLYSDEIQLISWHPSLDEPLATIVLDRIGEHNLVETAPDRLRTASFRVFPPVAHDGSVYVAWSRGYSVAVAEVVPVYGPTDGAQPA